MPLSHFNLDRNLLNKYVWSRIAPRIRSEHALVSTIYQSQFGFLFHPLSRSSSAVAAAGSGGGAAGTAVSSTSAQPLTTAAIDQVIVDIGYELKLLDMVRSLCFFCFVCFVSASDCCMPLWWFGGWLQAGRLREEFRTAVSAQKELQYVPPASLEHAFVGVGAFRLVPAFPIPVQQANALNVVLAHALARVNPTLYAIAMTTKEKLVCTVVRTSAAVLDKNCVVRWCWCEPKFRFDEVINWRCDVM